MSTIRTKIELIERIEENYVWRIQELSVLKNSIPLSDGPKQKVLIRASITLLYANWEGFVKESCDDYYDYVSHLGLNVNQLSHSFASVALKNSITELTSTKKITLQTKVVEYILTKFTHRAKFSSENPIKTSNLKFEIFEDICTLIGLNSSNYQLKETFINEVLLTNRNKIAHGKYRIVDYDNFLIIYDTCISLLKQVKEELILSIVNERYKI